MGGVGLDPGELPASLGVKFPNQRRILRPRFGARYILESVAVPEPSAISKRANPALRADSGASKDEYGRATRDGQGLERGMNSNVGHGCVAPWEGLTATLVRDNRASQRLRVAHHGFRMARSANVGPLRSWRSAGVTR